MLEWHTLLTGLIIFFARICDVSIGTIRTIVTVQGRTIVAFVLAVFEVTIWIFVAGTVINQIKEVPILSIFYAFGFASGNVVGILVERKIAFGLIVFKVITRDKTQALAEQLRGLGQAVTVFTGEGIRGPVYELYIVCRRRDLKRLIPMVKEVDPEAFYITEQARDASKVLRPICQPLTGWRAVLKRK
jgi:uncharacterized protein YebE (UPF0316 family)